MRLFIAVPFSEEFRAVLLDWQTRLREDADLHAGAPRWTSPENLHLTLAFIGEYGDPARVVRAMESVRFEPFSLRLGGSGHFGRLYWAGLADGRAAVSLAENVRRALTAEGISYDEKPMKPHITAARELTLLGTIPPLGDAEMTADRFTLFRSERIRGKLTYTPLYTRTAEPAK